VVRTMTTSAITNSQASGLKSQGWNVSPHESETSELRLETILPCTFVSVVVLSPARG
jgi:hypothetical protein